MSFFSQTPLLPQQTAWYPTTTLGSTATTQPLNLLAFDLLLILLLKTSVCAVWKVLAYRLIITCPNIRTTYGGHVRTDKYMISVKPNQ